jgi:hypothetical protein
MAPHLPCIHLFYFILIFKIITFAKHSFSLKSKDGKPVIFTGHANIFTCIFCGTAVRHVLPV